MQGNPMTILDSGLHALDSGFLLLERTVFLALGEFFSATYKTVNANVTLFQLAR